MTLTEGTMEMWDMNGSNPLFLEKQWEYCHCFVLWKCQAYKAVQAMLSTCPPFLTQCGTEYSYSMSYLVILVTNEHLWLKAASLGCTSTELQHLLSSIFWEFNQPWLVDLNTKTWLLISFVYWFPRWTRNQAEVSDITVERDKASMEQERWQHGARMQTEHTAWGHSGRAFIIALVCWCKKKKPCYWAKDCFDLGLNMSWNTWTDLWRYLLAEGLDNTCCFPLFHMCSELVGTLE